MTIKLNNLFKTSLIILLIITLMQFSSSFSEQPQTQTNEKLDKEMLAKIHEILVNIREDDDFNNDWMYRTKFSYYGADVIKYLIEIAKHDKDNTIRWMATQEIRLSEYNYLALDLFIELVDDENKTVRCQALSALGQISDKKATPILLKAMHDENYDIRYDAASALYDLEDKSATPELLKILKNGTDEDRYLACYALAGIKDPAAVPEVIKALKNENESLRREAAWVLRETKDERSVPALIEALVDESKDVRERAREALVDIGSKSAILYLIKFCEIEKYNGWGKGAANLILENKEKTKKIIVEALMHPDDGIRKNAVWLIGRMREKSAIPTLLEQLKDDETEIKLQVIKTLIEIKEKSVVPALIVTLKDEEVSVKIAAIKALRKFEAKSAIPVLLKLLKSKNQKLVNAAIKTLGGLKANEAVDDLIELLQKKPCKHKSDIIFSLGMIGDEKAVPLLVNELQNESVNIRTTVVRALARIDSKSAFNALTKVIKDDSKKVRHTLIYSLENSGVNAKPILILMFNDPDEDIVEDALHSTYEIGYKAIPELIKALRSEHIKIRINALEALAEYEDYSAESELVRLLTDEYVEIRILAAQALCNAGSESAIEPLIVALKDKNETVRANSARALGNIADVPDVTELIKILQDKDSVVRENAARALGEIQSKTAVPALVALLDDENVKVRYEAINALGEISDPQAVPALLKSLKDEGVVKRGGGLCGSISYDYNFYLRAETARVLSLIGDKTVVPEIIELLQDEVDKVREMSIVALAKLGNKGAIQPLSELMFDKAYDVSRAAMEALKNFEADAIPTFQNALTSKNRYVRTFAASALIEFKDKSVVPELIKSIDDGTFTDMTILSLINLGGKESVPYIIRALNTRRFREDAAIALAKIKDERAIAPLQKLYENSKYDAEKVSLAKSLYNLDVPDKESKLDFVVKTLMRYKNNEDDYSIDTLIEIAFNVICRIKNERTTSILIELSKDEKFGKQLEAIHELKKRLDKTAFKELYEKHWTYIDEDLDIDMGNVKKIIEDLISDLNNDERGWGKEVLSKHYPIRDSAILQLGEFKVQAVVPLLIKSLEVKYEQWRGYAVHALGEIGDKSAIEPLKKLFVDTNDKLLKVYIATALFKLDAENKDVMLNFVINALDSKKYGISHESAKALGEIGGKSAIAALLKALSTKDDWKRQHIIEALGKIGNESALPALKTILSEEPLRQNRENIKEAIAKIENTQK